MTEIETGTNASTANRTTGNTPIIYLDFDGVLNAFPDRDMMKRGGQEWLMTKARENDPRHDIYDLDKAFHLDGNTRIHIPHKSSYRIRWSRELSDNFKELMESGMVDARWLTTWQPYTQKLNATLGWDESFIDTVQWYNKETLTGLYTGKLDTVRQSMVAEGMKPDPTPIVWVDDDECDAYNVKKIVDSLPANQNIRLLMIRPNPCIGISRRQYDIIKDFVTAPEQFDTLTINSYDESGAYQHRGYTPLS